MTHNDDLLDLMQSGDEMQRRAEAAEARAAELKAQLAGAATTIVTLTKERDLLKDERDNWFHALQNVDRYLCSLAEDKSIALKATHTETIAEIVSERDKARLELQRIRTMLDDGTYGENDTAIEMVKRLQEAYHLAQREAWHERM